MSSRKRINRDQRLLSGDRGPGDGIDPRLLPRPGRRGGPGRKSLQLCEQVAQTLGMVLASECDDDMLRDAMVMDVIPAPDASCLLVTLAPYPSAEAWSPVEVLERVHRHARRLRAEVAAAINRRKTPALLYRVMM
jgi:ribosome-binding factor A